jgi:hypothetical protein
MLRVINGGAGGYRIGDELTFSGLTTTEVHANATMVTTILPRYG